MTEIEENIVNQFKNLALQHDITLIEKESYKGSTISVFYSVHYNSVIAKFIAELSDVNFDFIKQYVFANQFAQFLKDSDPFNIYIDLIVDDNGLYFQFSEFDNFDLTSDFFLTIYLMKPNQVDTTPLKFRSISSKHTLNVPSDYELAYNDTLLRIGEKLDPTVTTFKQILDINNHSKIDFINNRLANAGFKAVSFDTFKERYSLEDSNVFTDEFMGPLVATVDDKIFNSFLNDYYSPSFASKLKNIVSLSSFQEKFLKRNIPWNPSVANYFTITFQDTSKYSDYNYIHSICFGADPNHDSRCTIMLHDSGVVHFCAEGGKWLYDLDDIYNYLKEDFILKMEKHLQLDREDIRLQHLKVYEMLLFG